MTSFTESEVEDVALKWLEGLGWSVKHGPDIAHGTPDAERASYDQVVLEQRLRDAPSPERRGGASSPTLTYAERSSR